MEANLIDYVNLTAIAKHYDLKRKYISLEQTISIEQILIDFIRQNKV